jgi:hypothetical protein
MRRTRKHGLSYSPEYRAWQTMVHRCTNPKSPAWTNYGGRGITVCEAWLDNPTQFYLDMGKRPSPAHEIDRKDNDGPYSPENCRWVTRPTNDRNRRSNHLIEHLGESLPIAAWAERTGLGHSTITARLKMGWTVERTLETPARAKRPKGRALQDERKPCADCGTPVAVRRTRCITCSNKSRAKGNSVSPPPLYALATANLDSAEALARAA